MVLNEIQFLNELENLLGHDNCMSYCLGQCMKHIWNYNQNKETKNLDQAKYYLDKVIEMENKNTENNYMCKDGSAIELDQLFIGDDSIIWKITGFSGDTRYPIIGCNLHNGSRWLKPEWLRRYIPVDEDIQDID